MPSGGFVRVESQKIYDTDLMAWVALSTSNGVGGDVVVTNVPHVIVDSLPPSGSGLTDAELRASPVPMSLATAPTTPVTGTFWQATQPVSGPLTDAQLRAVAVPVSGTVAVTGAYQATQPVSAAALPLPSGASTEATLAALKARLDDVSDTVNSAITAAHPVLDTRAMLFAVNPGGTYGNIERTNGGNLKVAVEEFDASLPAGSNAIGSVSVSNFPATQPVSGPLTDTQLRATPVPVSGTVAVTGAYQTTQPVSLTTLPALVASSANIGDVDVLTMPAITGTVTANAGTGTFAVSAASLPLPAGAATETTLAALNTKTPALGQATMANSQPVVIASNQSAVPVSMASASVLFKGRACTFRTPGRAGTAGQKILSIHNATGSAVVVTVNKVFVDMWQTVIKAVTVAPPIVRAWKVTVLPTNGTALAKTKIGGTSTSNASVTVLGDTSADGTGSGTTLTATLPTGTFLSQQTAPRLITAAGYEVADRIEFFENTTVELQALEGLVVFVDYTLATQNPSTDMWLAGIEWTEN